jgi:hypothetical protein
VRCSVFEHRYECFSSAGTLILEKATVKKKGDRLLFTGVIKKVACPL